MAKKRKEYIVKLVASLPDGTHIIEHPGGRLERRKGQTDWKALDALTDEQIEAAIENDPDWEEFKDLDWPKAVLVAPPRKQAISIRVDEDVLAYFKHQGAGYQRRMNAVLRSYMQHHRSRKVSKKAKKRA
ncbi:MAG TPA: BrnA antitoxin family protein [Pseudolabrys sp.]|nr:BrnA antitoxin family protein [Pseudolabrys sp.]